MDHKPGDPDFVIRSYTAGKWAPPQTPLPAWFKEEKLPEPTREEF